MVDLKFFKNRIFVFTLLNNGIIFMGLMGLSMLAYVVLTQTVKMWLIRKAHL